MRRMIVQHLRTDISGKKPLPSDIMTGELAINYAANGETLFIKNTEEAIAEFKDDKYYQKQLSEKADKTYVDNSIAGLVDGAPETLDTLNELAAALNNNADIVDVLNQSISNKQDTLTAGTGIDITDNTISCTLDTTIFKVVDSLPTAPASGDENKMHLVLSSSSEEGNTYDEYLWANNSWEKIGSFRPSVDLSDYAKTSYVDSQITSVNNKLLKDNGLCISLGLFYPDVATKENFFNYILRWDEGDYSGFNSLEGLHSYLSGLSIRGSLSVSYYQEGTDDNSPILLNFQNPGGTEKYSIVFQTQTGAIIKYAAIDYTSGYDVFQLNSFNNGAVYLGGITENTTNISTLTNNLANEISTRTQADTELQSKIDLKQDKLTAGENIKIENNVISVIGGGSPDATKLSVNTTRSALKTLRDNSKLIPGTWYRITNYYAIISPTVADISSQGNGPLYDIVVLAISPNELSEEARATHHINDDGTIVLESSEIESWKVWYCIDNDTDRFSWAYSGGLGVVYRLIDEFGNDCPYDFKEILFKRYKITECANCTTLIGKYTSKEDSKYVIDKSQYIWAYTFTYLNTDGKVLDHSIVGATTPNNEGKYTGVYNNKMLPISSYLGAYSDNSTQFQYCLNNICFISDGVISKSLSYGCYSNTFGSNCYSMTFGTSCHSNTFGENCYENVFGNSIKYQSLGKNCHNNIFGDGHNHNELGNACSSNIFGTNYVYNTIGYNCYNNVFGDNYSHNSFGNSNYAFKLGNNLQSNAFLNYCSHIVFGSDKSFTEKYSYYKNNFFGNNCKYILFKGTGTASSSMQAQNYNFAQGLQGTSSVYLTIDGERNRYYETKVAKNSNGELKIYCEADLIL